MRCVRLLAGLSVFALLLPIARAQEDDDLASFEWPQEARGEDGSTLVVHEPQVDRWSNETIEARAAVALQFAGEGSPIYGAVWLQGDTRTNLDTRVVTVANLRIEDVRFPATGEHSQAEILARVQALFPPGPIDLALDRLLADLDRVEMEERAHETDLGSLVPRIFVETEPARLVLIDGEPVLEPIPGTALLHVVNTDWHILLEQATGTYYLRLADGWAVARDLATTRWAPASRAPSGSGSIPLTHPRAEARDTAVNPRAPVPLVRVSTEPAELVAIDGRPRMSPIPGTRLLYVVNTSNDLFLHTGDSHHYLLAAGRWFRAPRLEGPWAFVEGELPEDFERIPDEHPRSSVLVSVPGTPAAEEALLLAQIPRRAVIRRDEARLEVAYDGPPRFVPCSSAGDVEYAVNTAYDVVHVGPRYYGCHEGVWFVAEQPVGPWLVADQVPPVIYSIGPRCPVYRVTFVRIYDASPELVVVGYLPGYHGHYVDPRRRVVVFGTGWHYRPYLHGAVWFGWPRTFGLGVAYHPYVSSYIVGATYYTPLAVRPVRATWYPNTAQFYRAHRSTNAYLRWGPRVIHDRAEFPRRAHVAGARGPIVGFGARHGRVRVVPGTHGAPVRRPPELRPPGDREPGRRAPDVREPERRPDPRTPGTRPPTRRAPDGASRADRRIPLFVGPDGRVFRRSTNGWEERSDDRSWRSLPTPRATPRPTPRPEPGTSPRPTPPRTLPGVRPNPPTRTPGTAPVPAPREDLRSRLDRAARTRQFGARRLDLLRQWRERAPSIERPRASPPAQRRVAPPREPRKPQEPPERGERGHRSRR